MSESRDKDRPLAVSFDAVGTFLHLAEPAAVTYNRLAREFGLEATELTMYRRLPLALQVAPPMVTPKGEDRGDFERRWWLTIASRVLGCAPDDRAFVACFDTLFDYFSRPLAWRVHESFGPMLLKLKEIDVKLAVISNFDARLYHLLDEMLPGIFDVVALPGDCGAQKPQVEIFNWAAAQLDVSPSSMMHLGDHEEEDVVAAQAAGLRSLRWSFPLEHMERPRERLLSYWGIIV